MYGMLHSFFFYEILGSNLKGASPKHYERCPADGRAVSCHSLLWFPSNCATIPRSDGKFGCLCWNLTVSDLKFTRETAFLWLWGAFRVFFLPQQKIEVNRKQDCSNLQIDCGFFLITHRGAGYTPQLLVSKGRKVWRLNTVIVVMDRKEERIFEEAN